MGKQKIVTIKDTEVKVADAAVEAAPAQPVKSSKRRGDSGILCVEST